MMQRALPRDIDAEKSVLGSMLLNSLVSDDVADILGPDDFFDRDHGELYRQIMALHALDRRVDAVLLVSHLNKQELPRGFGGDHGIAEFVRSLAEYVPHAGNAVYYARLVREAAALREVIAASEETLHEAYAPKCEPAEVLSQAESRLFAILERRTAGKTIPIQDVLVQSMAELASRSESGGTSGVPTGLHDLDTHLGGLRAGELIILAGRTGMGKTAMACNIAEHAARSACTLFVSLEMSVLELGDRMLAAKARVSAHKMRSGFLGALDRKRLVEAQVALSQSQLHVDESYSASVTQIAAQARRMKRKHNLGLLIVDYLQIVTPENPRDSRQEQVALIARRLKGLARELNVPVLCLAQLNRQADAGDGKPRLSHLRESGSIEQDADVVLFCHRPDYYARTEDERRELAGQAQVIVAKHRHGPSGEVRVTWLAEYMRFESVVKGYRQNGKEMAYEGAEFNPDEWAGGEQGF